jgi:hypothetical protein
MPRNIIIQRAFFGYNNHLSPFLVPDDILTRAVNVVLDDVGNIKKMNGYSEFNSTAISANPVIGIYRHYEGTGEGTSNKEMLTRVSTTLHKSTDATGAQTAVTVAGVALTTNRVSWTTFLDLCIFTNFSSPPKKYSIGGTAQELGGSPPAGKYITTHYNRVWLANISGDESIVRFSEVYNAEVWPAKYQLPINEGDGDQITNIAPVASGLIVWKRHSTWIIVGNSLGSFGIFNLSKSIGCVAPYSISELNGRWYFLSNNGIYSTAGETPVLESYPIQGDINDIRKAAYEQVFGFNHLNKWYVMAYQSSANTDTENKRILILDTRIRDLNAPESGRSAWTKGEVLPINCATSWNSGDDANETYFGESGNGLIRRFDDTATFAGTNFSVDVRTKFYGNEIEKVYDLLYIDAEADSGGTLNVDYETNQPTNSGRINMDLSTVGFQLDSDDLDNTVFGSEGTREFKGSFGADAVGRYNRLTMRDAASDKELIIRGINISFVEQPAFV